MSDWTHDLQYVIGDQSDGYIAKCSGCNWIAGGFASPHAAREAYREHAKAYA